jgi:uncharacterized membrane protein YbhN (UPF0104 family)
MNDPHPPQDAPPPEKAEKEGGRAAAWFWIILKNVIGWALIVAAWPIGILLPGPGGIPLFLIGFALVSFPGKRRLMARILRGRHLHLDQFIYTIIAILLAVGIPPLLFWILLTRYLPPHAIHRLGWPDTILVFVLVMGIIWLLARTSFRLLNWLIVKMPQVRRKVRPWLKEHGVRLLPPRWRRQHPTTGERHRHSSEEILLFHERHGKRLHRLWDKSRPWLLRWAAAIIALAVFIGFSMRIYHHWGEIRMAASRADLWRLIEAIALFAVFLLVFRVLSWRWILSGMGHRLPLKVSARIWSASEFARYLPGGIWQMVGRIWLCRPYGVGAGTCSASQILELAVFLLANILLGGGCLIWFGWKLHPDIRRWLVILICLLPALLILLHPRIFYALTDFILDLFSKPPITRRLGGWDLVGLTLWNIVGLLWQSVAIWLIVAGPLGLKLAWWWMVAGAYCLAWCAGFLSFFSPAGIGVREFIFVMVLKALLPQSVKNHFPDSTALGALLAFLSIVLRLWAMGGELLVLLITHVVDYRGVLRAKQDRSPRDPVSRQ